jgi:hypothetical protein
MKGRHIIAIAIGALISIVLLILPLPGSWTFYLGAPGIITMLVLGPQGPVGADMSGMAVVLVVNAIVYSLVTLAVVSVFKNSN